MEVNKCLVAPACFASHLLLELLLENFRRTNSSLVYAYYFLLLPLHHAIHLSPQLLHFSFSVMISQPTRVYPCSLIHFGCKEIPTSFELCCTCCSSCSICIVGIEVAPPNGKDGTCCDRVRPKVLGAFHNSRSVHLGEV